MPHIRQQFAHENDYCVDSHDDLSGDRDELAA